MRIIDLALKADVVLYYAFYTWLPAESLDMNLNVSWATREGQYWAHVEWNLTVGSIMNIIEV